MTKVYTETEGCHFLKAYKRQSKWKQFRSTWVLFAYASFILCDKALRVLRRNTYSARSLSIVNETLEHKAWRNLSMPWKQILARRIISLNIHRLIDVFHEKINLVITQTLYGALHIRRLKTCQNTSNKSGRTILYCLQHTHILNAATK